MKMNDRMENGKKRTGNRKKAGIMAALALSICAVSIPVQAAVTSVVEQRMESVPKAEIKDIENMIQSQHDVQADGFSREYSAKEKERKKQLWQAYKNGTFPEQTIRQVEGSGEAEKGTLCYIRSTGVFQLPAEEMTDEEMLEIIDFQHKMSYAIANGEAAKAARAEQ